MGATQKQARSSAALAFRSGLEAANARRWVRARRLLATAIAGGGPAAVWAVQEVIQTHLAEGTVEAGERWIRTGLPAGALRDHALGYLLRRTGRRRQAVPLFARALAARPALMAAASEFGIALCQRGQRRRGLALLRRAEAHFRRRHDSWGESIALALRATQAMDALALPEAVALFHRALRLKRRAGDRVGEGAVLHNLGLAHYFLCAYDRAGATLERALALQRQRGDRRGAAYSLNTLGLVELDLTNPTRAAVHLREAARIFRRLGDTRGLAIALGNRAEARRLRGELAAAADDFRAVRDLEEAAGNRDSVGMAVANLAAIRVAQGQPRAALQAIRALSPGVVGRANSRTRLFLGRERARALLALGESARALDAVRRALARLEREREPGSRHTEVAELDARVLEGEALLAVGRAAASLALVRRLARRVERLLRRQPVAGTRISLLETSRAVHDLWLRLLSGDRRSHLEQAWVIVAGLKARELGGSGTGGRQRPRVPPRHLAAGEALIEYHVTPATTWAFVGTPAAATWLDLQLPERRLAKAIARLLEPLRAAGASADPAIDLSRFEPARARQLYHRLLAPALASLARPPRRLLIVPHGPLHRLPFELLAPAGPDGVERWAVCRLPSSLGGRRPRPPGRPTLLAVAYSPRRRPASAAPAAIPLPGAVREVREVGRLYPRRRLLIGDRATADAFAGAAAAASVIHVAAHAVADPVEPGRSAILLAAAGRPSGEQLRAARIARLPLRPALVVLSACESHAGRLRVHEGIQGLARAFLDAGAEAVIASLWRVDDAATRRFMVELHRRLRAGAGRDQALAMARARLRASAAWSHPYFWAAFVLIDRRPAGAAQ